MVISRDRDPPPRFWPVIPKCRLRGTLIKKRSITGIGKIMFIWNRVLFDRSSNTRTTLRTMCSHQYSCVNVIYYRTLYYVCTVLIIDDGEVLLMKRMLIPSEYESIL